MKLIILLIVIGLSGCASSEKVHLFQLEQYGYDLIRGDRDTTINLFELKPNEKIK